MSRVIKFRVWDAHKKVMIYQDHTDLIYKCLKYYDQNIKTTLMQYIEENDKDNTEIYDGDIVLIPAGYGSDTFYEEAIGVIVYGADYPMSKNLSDINYDELTVIGNIYERPDLIKYVDFGMFNDYKENLFKDIT